MMGIMQVLLINVVVCAVALLLLLFLYSRKNSRSRKVGKPLSRDARKIKEEIME